MLEKLLVHLKFNYPIEVIEGVDCKKTPEGGMPKTMLLHIEGAQTAEQLARSLSSNLRKRFKNYTATVISNSEVHFEVGVITGQKVQLGETYADIQSTH